MGQKTRYTPLPDQAYDPRVTDLSKPFNVPAATGPQAVAVDPSTGAITSLSGGWYNRNVTNMFLVQLVAGVSQRVLVTNPRRTGVIIENKDATNTINYSFANDLQSFGLQIAAGGSVLLDFTTPADALYLYSGVGNVQVAIAEFSRNG